jgi:death on curing protein
VNKFTIYPTLEEVLFLHDRLLSEFGGSEGVRDLGLLESALARPRSGYYGTVYEQAAALMQSLVNNHAFVDGNMRVGSALTAVFLFMNGFQLSVPAEVGETFIVETLIGDRADLPTIAQWLQKHSKPRKS